MNIRATHQATPLPKGWTEYVRSALLHAISLATTALTFARSRAATSRSSRRCLQAELDRAHTEIALLKEELDIKDDRWSRLPCRRRPHYTPVQQLQALLPTMGKVRIASVLARAGLHLGVTTVGRILKETEPLTEEMTATVPVE